MVQNEGIQKESIEQETPKQQGQPPIAETANNVFAVDKQRQIVVTAKKSAQESQAEAAQEVQTKAVQEVQAEAAQEAQAAQEIKRQADVKAVHDAQAADAKAAAAKMTQAANDGPVSFGARDASWAVAPRLSFPERAKRGTSSGDSFTVLLALRVNKQGRIDRIRLVQSSGNTALDKEALHQVKTGKLVPFTKDGSVVVGSVTLPITYKVP